MGAKTTRQQTAEWKGSCKINCSKETAHANSSPPAESHVKAGPEIAMSLAEMSRGLLSPYWGTAPRGRYEMAKSREGKALGQENSEWAQGVYYMSGQ